MLNRRFRAAFLFVFAAALLAAPLHASEEEVANDSVVDNSTIAVQAGFVIGETGAAVLDASAYPATIKDLRVFAGKEALLPGPNDMTVRFHVWASSPPATGAAIYTSPDVTIGVGGFSVWDVQPENLVVNGPFTVGVEIVNTGVVFGLSNPSLVTDTNGCQGGKNWVRQTNGVWANLCGFGVSGDLAIRATVDVPDQGQFIDVGNSLSGNFSPTLLGGGSLAAGQNLTLVFANLPPFDAGWLFIGVFELNAPFLGGTLVPDPLVTIILPTGPGTIVINDTMPGGIPSGAEIFLHMWVADPGGPQGASATNALKLITP